MIFFVYNKDAHVHLILHLQAEIERIRSYHVVEHVRVQEGLTCSKPTFYFILLASLTDHKLLILMYTVCDKLIIY